MTLKELVSLDNWLSAIVKSSDDAIVAKTLDGTIVAWNGGAERMYGWPAEEAIGQNVALIVPPECLDELAVMLEVVGRGEHIDGHESRRVCRDGTILDVSVSIAPIRDASEEVIGASAVARDITTVKEALRQLHASSALATAMVDSALDCVIMIDHEGRVLEFNPAAERTFGYQRSEVMGSVLADLIIPESTREQHSAGLRRRVAGGEGTALGKRREVIALRADGTTFPAELAVTRIDAPGSASFVGYLRDISPRRKVEEELVQSKHLLQDVVDNSPAIIYAKDVEGRHILVNAAFEDRYGFDRSWVLGRTGEEIWPADIARTFRENDLSVIASGRPVQIEETVEESGVQRTYLSVKFPLRGSDGAESGVAGISTDITERKELEQSMLASEHSYRLLFDAHPQPMWIWELETMRFLYVNDAAVANYGYSRDEFMTMTIKDIRAPGDVTELLDSLVGLPDFEQSGPWPHLKKDGSVIKVAISSTAVTFDGHSARFVLGADVTEQERQAQRTQQAQRLESLGELAGGVAHDFNNLLAVILNYAAFVNDEVAAAATSDGGPRWQPVLSDVAQITKAADRATRLTRQLLAFARREVVRRETLNLREVVEDMAELLRRTIGEHVRLVVSSSADLSCVLADRGQLEQVLVNLAVNARDAMPNGGVLTIDLADLDVDADYSAVRPLLAPGSYVRLRVSDTGVGMAADVMQHAFEPFFSTKTQDKGTGLGLATVYGIITQGGGDVHIYSEPGIGTSVSVIVPSSDSSVVHAKDEEIRGRPESGAGKTVLVVDDEAAILEVARRILTRNGYEVLPASDGLAAVEIADQHAGLIDLLISDVVMPQMLGKEVAERVTTLHPETRVLYMSGYAKGLGGPTGELAEGTELLSKPFTEAGLLTAVQVLLKS